MLEARPPCCVSIVLFRKFWDGNVCLGESEVEERMQEDVAILVEAVLDFVVDSLFENRPSIAADSPDFVGASEGKLAPFEALFESLETVLDIGRSQSVRPFEGNNRAEHTSRHCEGSIPGTVGGSIPGYILLCQRSASLTNMSE